MFVINTLVKQNTVEMPTLSQALVSFAVMETIIMKFEYKTRSTLTIPIHIMVLVQPNVMQQHEGSPITVTAFPSSTLMQLHTSSSQVVKNQFEGKEEDYSTDILTIATHDGLP